MASFAFHEGPDMEASRDEISGILASMRGSRVRSAKIFRRLLEEDRLRERNGRAVPGTLRPRHTADGIPDFPRSEPAESMKGRKLPVGRKAPVLEKPAS